MSEGVLEDVPYILSATEYADFSHAKSSMGTHRWILNADIGSSAEKFHLPISLLPA
jgi:hypothetical protein